MELVSGPNYFNNWRDLLPERVGVHPPVVRRHAAGQLPESRDGG
jgi:hypothetical protein